MQPRARTILPKTVTSARAFSAWRCPLRLSGVCGIKFAIMGTFLQVGMVAREGDMSKGGFDEGAGECMFGGALLPL